MLLKTNLLMYKISLLNKKTNQLVCTDRFDWHRRYSIKCEMFTQLKLVNVSLT